MPIPVFLQEAEAEPIAVKGPGSAAVSASATVLPEPEALSSASTGTAYPTPSPAAAQPSYLFHPSDPVRQAPTEVPVAQPPVSPSYNSMPGMAASLEERHPTDFDLAETSQLQPMNVPPSGPKRPSWRIYASMTALFLLSGLFVLTALITRNHGAQTPDNSQTKQATLLGVGEEETLAIQGNLQVSSLTNLHQLVVNGQVTLGQNISVIGNGVFTGTVKAKNFVGDGSQLTNLPIPTIPNVPDNVALLSPATAQSGGLNVTGVVAAGGLQGNGANITGINAAHISSGKLSDNRLSSNVALLDANNTFSGTNSFDNVITQNGNVVCDISNNCGFGGGGGSSFVQGGNSFAATANLGTNDNFSLNLRTNGVTRFTLDTSGNSNLTGTATATAFSGDGSALTSLNATNLQSGTVNDARLSSNVPLKGGANTFTALNNFTGGLEANGNTVCDTSGNCTAAGSAGGDLTGSYPNPTIAKLQGTTITVAGLAAANFLQYNGTAWVNQSISGDVVVNSGGVATVQANSVALTTDTTGDYVANLGTLTGLSTSGNSGEGSTPTLSVTYGSGANTAVQGNVTLTCSSGTGNLSGGGNSITLGTGGSCNSLSTVNNPTFTTSVTTPLMILTGAGSNGQLQVANLGQVTTYTLPDPGGAAATICLTTGNCAGTGSGVTTAGGSTGVLAKFSGSQAIADSTLSESGSTLTASGTLVVQGSNALTLGTAAGNTGAILLKNGTNSNTLTLQSGVSGSNFSLTLPTSPGSNGDCLQTNGAGGVLSFSACTGGAGGGVTSIDSQTGVVTLANSSGSSGTITIDNAAADGSTKGIATFNSTNFSASSGVINTIQNIATSSTPTFAAATLTNASSLTLGQASTNTGSILFKGSGSANSLTLQGPASPGANTLTLPNETGTLCSTGSVCTGYAPATGGSGYVQLQGSTPGSAQTGSFNISGTGIAGKLLVGYSSNTSGVASFNGHVSIGNINAFNSWLYIGAGTGSLTDAPVMGLKVSVDSTASTTPDGAQVNVNVIQGTPAGAIHGVVSRVDVNDASSNTGDTVGTWGDVFVHSASARNTWGLEAMVQIDSGSAYTGTAVGGELGITNLDVGNINPGGGLHVTSTNSTEYSRFGLKISSDKFKSAILIPDGSHAPSDNAFYYGPLAANNVPTGTPEAILTAAGKFGLGVASPDAYLHVTSSASGTKAVVIQGASSQSADLLRFLDSSGNDIGGFNANARLYLGRASNTVGQIDFFGSGSANSIALKGPTSPGSSLTITLPNETGTLCSTGSLCSGYAAASGSTNYIQNGTSIQTSANFAIQSAALGSVGGVIKAAASQSADLFELQDSSGNITAKFSAGGNQLTLGRIAASGTVTAGSVLFGDGTTDNLSLTLQSATLTSSSKTLTLPNETGTLCSTASVCSGYAPASGSGIYFAQGGNSFTAQAVLGTNDNNSLAFRTNSGNRLVVDTSGNLTFQQASTISTVAGSGAAGADLSINTGAGASGFAGGAINIQPGSATGTQNGSAVTITGGTASGLSTGGTVAIVGGSGPLIGGAVTITGGTASGAAFPGNVYINGGTGTSSSLGNVLIGTKSDGTSQGSGSVVIGNSAMTGNLVFGNSTAGQTINIGHAIVATGNTQTINIGDQATGTGKDVITIGNSNGASSLVLNAGTGGVTIGNSSAPFSVASTAFNLTTAGVITGVTGFTEKSSSSSAFTLQNSGGTINLLQFDASAVVLKVFDSTGANYASISATTNSATFTSNTGTTNVGNGTGDVNVTLSNNSEKFNFLHNVTSGGAATSSDNDFVITRQLVTTNNALAGNVAKIEDLSTFTGGSSAPNLLYLNQNNTSATGNLILAQTGGSTTRFSVSTTGATTIAGLLTGSAGATVSGAAISLNVSSNFATNINTGTSTGAVTIGAANASSAVTIEAGTGATAIQIGNGATAHGIQIGSNATGDNDILIGGTNSGSTLTLESGTAATAIQIGNGATAHGIQIGTGAAIQTIVVGSTNSTSSTLIQGGTGNVQIQSQGGTLGVGNNAVAQTLNIGNVTGATAINERVGTGNYTLDGVTNSTYTLGASTTTGTITIGGTAQTGNITLGSSNGTNSVLIGNGSGATTVSIANANTGGAVNLGAAFTTGTITLGATGQTGTITIGQATTASTQTVSIESGNGSSSTQTVNIAGGTSATSGGKVVNIANGTPGSSTTNTVAIGTGGSTTGTVGVTIGSNAAAAHTTLIQGGNGATAIQLQTATAGTIGIGNNAVANTVNIANANGANNTTVAIGSGVTGGSNTAGITIGSNNAAASTTLIQGGNGATAIQLVPNDSGAIVIGGATQTGAITVGKSTDNQTINIGTGATANGKTLTIHIGDGGAAGSTTNITVGSAIAGTLTVQSVATFNKALTVGGHIISTNTSGTTTVATGAATDCTGGTPSASISGNDTAGTVTFNTGTTCSAGVLGTVTFANAYGAAPIVTLTPVNASGSTLQYYSNSSGTTTFTVDTNTAAADSTTYKYTYHIIQ